MVTFSPPKQEINHDFEVSSQRAFSGLSKINPVLALTFTFTLLSIAGIPPLAGFFSKYLILLNNLLSSI